MFDTLSGKIFDCKPDGNRDENAIFLHFFSSMSFLYLFAGSTWFYSLGIIEWTYSK